MRLTTCLPLVALVLAGCQMQRPSMIEAASPAATGTTAPSAVLSGKAAEGAEMAEALCSGCHAYARGQISPNPEAPAFARIANMESLTEETLRDWLRDSHNFPETMNFEVVEGDVEALAAYIITLRDGGTTPPTE